MQLRPGVADPAAIFVTARRSRERAQPKERHDHSRCALMMLGAVIGDYCPFGPQLAM
jgi:hypothetical protein